MVGKLQGQVSHCAGVEEAIAQVLAETDASGAMAQKRMFVYQVLVGSEEVVEPGFFRGPF
ncbi:hypothetical protein D3C73_1649760 [compost metagenome]